MTLKIDTQLNAPVLGKLVKWFKVYFLYCPKHIVQLKELVYQNTSNEPLFYLIRNDVHIKSAITILATFLYY